MIRWFLLLTVLLSLRAITQAQTPTGPFTGFYRDGFENAPLGVHVVYNFFGNGSTFQAFPAALYPGYVASGFSHSGSKFFDAADDSTRLDMTVPVRRIGCWIRGGGVHTWAGWSYAGGGSGYTLIPYSGSWTWIGWDFPAPVISFDVSTDCQNGGCFKVDDFEADPWLYGPVTIYCTAKTNSLGCTPAIGWSGAPSATGHTSFLVSATQVRNNKPGVLFYGFLGSASLPFQGGTMCVATSIKRTPGVNSGGAPAPIQDCSGIYQFDMSCFAAGHCGGNPPAPLHTPGTVVNCQWWGRDPGFVAPFNTTLSDALEYTVGP